MRLRPWRSTRPPSWICSTSRQDPARQAIRNPQPHQRNLSIMRTLLAPSMLNVIVDNLKKGNAAGRLFELAPRLPAQEPAPDERPHERQTLCMGVFGPGEDFFTVKGAMEALAASLGLAFAYQRGDRHPLAAPRHRGFGVVQGPAAGRVRQAVQ